ncbi:MAG: hypothetical protein LBC39_01175 [Methanobrevibacter sp.]|jgi:adenine-specific DNA-methyltransferase|nr:hypothetical protein [Candidatus Methanovirga aequatorialis]
MIESTLNGESKNLVKENIEKLKELFPEILTEDKIDFQKLKTILSEEDELEENKERYNFTWNGKTKTIQETQKPSTGTLRPVKNENKDWDTTQNLYIEGQCCQVNFFIFR